QVGDVFELPVLFEPTIEGPILGALALTTERGTFDVPLTGVGASRAPAVVAAPAAVAFQPTAIGTRTVELATITNVSDTDLTISAVSPPAAPFSATGLPAIGTVLPAGQAFTVTLTFSPSSTGVSSGYLAIQAGPNIVASVAIEGAASGGGRLRVTPA